MRTTARWNRFYSWRSVSAASLLVVMMVESRVVEAQGRLCALGSECGQLGLRYIGDGPGRDLERAIGYFEQGCMLDDALSCHYLGSYHERGIVYERNRRRAVELYRHACELGRRRSCEHVEPEPPEWGWRFHPYASVGLSFGLQNAGGTRFSTDAALGLRQRLVRFRFSDVAIQLVPQFGYTYYAGLSYGGSWTSIGLGLRVTLDEETDFFAVTVLAAALLRSVKNGEVGYRITLRLGAVFDFIFLEVSYDRHMSEEIANGGEAQAIRVMGTLNFGGLLGAADRIW